MKIHHKLIFCFLSLSTSLFGQKSYDLYQPDNESKTYIARDYIILHPGYSFNNAGGKTLYLGIDEQIIDTAFYQTISQLPNPNRSINTGCAVGAIAGEASTSPTGAGVYQIPIEVMPGTGGMQPNVSIVYNSQSGNGLVGYGWSLGALSAITRVGKTIYHDGAVGVPDLTTSDNLMLDGQRLMRASGSNLATSSTYKTEIETYLDITCKSLNSYLGFEVKNKEGWTLEYGSSADSYIKPKGSSVAYAWLLKKVTDANGNYMTYTYDNNPETGEFRLKQIDYTGNDAAGLNTYNKIEFCYETRTDQSASYIAGSSVQQSVILRKIICSAYGSTIKDYRFNYYFDGIYSKLTEVEEYGQNGIRYNSTVIDWGDYTGDYSRHTSEGYASLSDIKEGTYPVYADFNGDGKTDFISYAEKSPNTSYTSSDVATLYLAATVNGVVSFIKQCTIPLISGFNKFYTGDFNGDGNMDIVREYTQNSKFYYTFFTFNGSQFVQGNTIETGANKLVQTGDYNGDGKDEIFFLNTSNYSTVYGLNNNLIASYQFPQDSGNATSCESNSVYFSKSKSDVNGNGKTDILLSQIYTCTSGGFSMCPPCTKNGRSWIEVYELDSNNNFAKIIDQDASTSLTTKMGDDMTVMVGDFNGDGKQDILCRNDDKNAQTTSLDIYFSTGTSFEKKTLSNLGLKPDFPIVSISDFNNDGKSDFVYFYSDSQNKHFTYIYTSTGDNFTSEAYPSNVLIPDVVIKDTKTVSIGDFDGDGRNELIYAKWNNQSYIQTFNDKQNLQVKNIINGLNRKITFDYKPITDNGYYTESVSSYTFPVSKFRQPLYVVTAINTVSGSLNSQDSCFYKNARVHRQGKGFLGFEEIRTISYQKNRSIITQSGYNPTYFNVYPVKQTVTTTAGDSISRTDFGNDLYTTSVVKVIFPYVSSQNAIDKLTGISKKTDYTYIPSDEGNPNKVTETQGSLISETSYVWEAKNSAHKNRVTQQDINKKGLGTPFVETKKFEYDAKARLTKKTDYYGNAKAVTTEYSNYDNFGNPLAVKTTAINCPTVTASSTFDGTGRFETTHTNALGNVSSANYDSNTGVLLNQTDIAGLKTTYQYDNFQKLVQKTNSIDDINYSTAWEISGNNLYKTVITSKINGQQTSWYNAAGLEIKSQSPGFSGTVVSEKEYNSNGQLYRSYLPGYGSKSSQYVEYAYDVFGRISKEINLGRTTSYSYSGLTTTITAPDGTSKSSTLNLSGLVESSKDAANNAVTYGYNSLGKQETVTSNGITTYIKYDDRGFQRVLKDANMTDSVKYEYDAYGQLTSQTNARKQATSFQYDAAGRMTQESCPERTLTYQYVLSGNGIGQVQTIKQDNAIVRSYGYTPLSRVSSVTEKIDGADYTTSYAYNDYGQMQEQQSPSGMRVSYQYNNGLLTSMRKADNNALLWQLNAANPLGQITESTWVTD